MNTIILCICGVAIGFSFMALGLLGIVVGRTMGASYRNKELSDSMSRQARLYGLVWLLVGFLVLMTVVVKANEATQGGISIGVTVQRV